MKKLLLAGGTGFLGQVLADHFSRKNWEVLILSRNQSKTGLPGRIIHWEPSHTGSWISEIEGVDAVVNLCGTTVNCRYNRRNRRDIEHSRTHPTRVLREAIQSLKTPPSVWLNASSATIYKHSEEDPMRETTGEIGHGFSVDVCKAWEREFFQGSLPKTRRIALRTSMVLGQGKNSVYPVLAKLARYGLGGKLASGKQMVSWIHQTDFARAIEFLIEEESLHGPINVTAPAPVENNVFMKCLRNSLNVPFGLPHFKPLLEVAAFLMRTETELTLKSRFVVPEKLLEHRFLFRYPFIDEAFYQLAGSERTLRFPSEPEKLRCC